MMRYRYSNWTQEHMASSVAEPVLFWPAPAPEFWNTSGCDHWLRVSSQILFLVYFLHQRLNLELNKILIIKKRIWLQQKKVQFRAAPAPQHRWWEGKFILKNNEDSFKIFRIHRGGTYCSQRPSEIRYFLGSYCLFWNPSPLSGEKLKIRSWYSNKPEQLNIVGESQLGQECIWKMTWLRK